MQIRNNPHLIGICSIAAVSIIAFWGFGLAEKITPQEKISQFVNILTDESESIVQNQILSSASAGAEPKETADLVFEKKTDPVKKTTASISRPALPEKSEFSISLSGTYYAGSPSLSKPASLALKFRPVSGSNLGSFEVTEAKMMFDSFGVPIAHPSIAISGNDVFLTFASDAVGSFVIRGTMDESILSEKSNKQTIVVEKQIFYLAQKDLPYHLDMTGTISGS